MADKDRRIKQDTQLSFPTFHAGNGWVKCGGADRIIAEIRPTGIFQGSIYRLPVMIDVKARKYFLSRKQMSTEPLMKTPYCFKRVTHQ